ncbi:MAG: hypothetical protein ACFWUE_01505 [Xylanivirga thermophila]|uniref:protease complex subunit PrcB family protein n=1 Tax=Xylanivirga thermophila TaxID=2496273 RepID=UPI0039F57638
MNSLLRLFIVAIISLSLIIPLVACSKVSSRPKDKPIENYANTASNIYKQKDNDKNKTQDKNASNEFYKIMDSKNYPDDIAESLSHIQDLRGFGIIKETENAQYLFIGLGQKPTAGYKIDISSFEIDNNKLNIKIKENSPAKDAMVAEMLTYPHVIIEITKKLDINNIVITTEDGEILQDINAEEEGK